MSLENGYWLLEADFAAIEYALMAAIAGEDGIVDAYNKGWDLHKETASVLWRKPMDQVTGQERDDAKTVNYGTIYGISPTGMSKRTDKTPEEAGKLIALFFKARPKLHEWMQRQKDLYKANKGFVTTFMGRRQVIPEFFGNTNMERSKADRASMNRPIQGGAADIQKRGIIVTVLRMAKRWSHDLARLILQTHDSQTWENHRSLSPVDVIPVVYDAMSIDPAYLPGHRLKLRVDFKIGVTWGTMYDWDNTDPKHLGIKQRIEGGEDWQDIYDSLVNEWKTKRDQLPKLEIIAAEAKTDSISSKIDEIDSKTPGIINFWPEIVINRDLMTKMVDLLDNFPGQNLVEVFYYGKEGSVRFKSHPTSFNERTLVDAMRHFMPNCRAEIDKTALVAAVVGDL